MKISVFIFTLLISSSAFAESNYLDALIKDDGDGRAFTYIDPFSYNFSHKSNDISKIFDGYPSRIEFPIENKSLQNKITVNYVKSENLLSPNGKIQYKQSDKYISCSDKGKLRKLKKPITIYDGVHIFNYEVNGKAIGYYAGLIINNKPIMGTYKFINGEEHEITSCVDIDGSLAAKYKEIKLSQKGVKLRNKLSNVTYKYDFDETGSTLKQSTDKSNYIGENGFKFVDDYVINIEGRSKNISDYTFAIDKPISVGNYNKEFVVPKCDGTDYRIDENESKILRMSNRPVQIELFYKTTPIGTFKGLVTCDSSKWIEPIKGIYYLKNGEITERSICWSERVNVLKNVKEFTPEWKAHLTQVAEEKARVEAEEIEQARIAAVEAENTKKRQAEEERQQKINEDKWRRESEIAEKQKAIDKKKEEQRIAKADQERVEKIKRFRKNLRNGDKVAFKLSPYEYIGKVTTVSGDDITVNVTHINFQDFKGFVDVSNRKINIQRNIVYPSN